MKKYSATTPDHLLPATTPDILSGDQHRRLARPVSARDPYEILDELMVVVESLCPTRPTRSAPRRWQRILLSLAATCASAGAIAALTAVIVPAARAATPGTVAAAPASAALAKALQHTRILVVGGTGRNGSAIVAALEAVGAKPRVLARDIAKAREKFPGEREWIQGDVTRPETLAAAVQGIDVIINAVATMEFDGPNGVEAVDLGGMRNLIAAAKPAGVKRMVFITGQTVGRDPSTWLVPAMKKGFGAKREAEKLLIASGLEYAILRPTGIIARPGNDWAIGVYSQQEYQHPTEQPRMGQLRQLPAADQPPPLGTIARPDLAEVAIVCAVDRRARNRIFVVSHGEGRASSAWTKRLARMPRN